MRMREGRHEKNSDAGNQSGELSVNDERLPAAQSESFAEAEDSQQGSLFSRIWYGFWDI